MEPVQTTPSPGPNNSSSGSTREHLANAIQYWEPRRLVYNLVLLAVTAVWFLATWPHFRAALTVPSLLLFAVLGLLANVCYCAAYLVDLPMQCSSLGSFWKQRRWGLWLAGTLFAAVLASYWIVDEIYPDFR
jgi:hypothetical protein